MEIKLTFKITTVPNDNGESQEVTQDISIPASPEFPIDQQRAALMMKMFHQYAQTGLLRQPEKDKFILMCPSQIAFIECELPSILIAHSGDVPKLALD